MTYSINKAFVDFAIPFASATPVPLRYGSEGGLWTSTGMLATTDTAYGPDVTLVQAYSGLLTNPLSNQIDSSVLDTDDYYFNLVYDAGYSTEVKSAIVSLAMTRQDCIAILDNGDNPTVDAAIATRTTSNTFNTYYAGIHEPYTKVYDEFNGQYIWVSPCYHMSYLLPANDNVAQQWYAAAGFTRGVIQTIEQMRYNPKQGDRDQFYMNQINSIVKFANGYTLWSQLTTQAQASAMQDINVVRLVLYCKKALSDYCKYYIFEQNDATTWGKVSTEVVSFLQNIKSARGLDSFSVAVAATDYELKTKTFHVNVSLTPTKTTEKILLNFFIM
jgi:phage tail sheath protein FI